MTNGENKNKKGLVIFLTAVIIVLSMVLGVIVYELNFGDKFTKEIIITEKPEDDKPKVVTTEYINQKLEGMGELVTQKMAYTGLYTVSEGKIPFITKKGFSMVYEAEVEARVNFAEIEFTSDETGIKFLIPHSELQTPVIDPESIQFFDEKRAVFNWQKKEDAVDAQAAAREDVLKKYDFTDMLKNADDHAVLLLKTIFSTEETPVTVEFKEISGTDDQTKTE